MSFLTGLDRCRGEVPEVGPVQKRLRATSDWFATADVRRPISAPQRTLRAMQLNLDPLNRPHSRSS